MYDPSPSPPADRFSREFRSFVDACLQKEADLRPTAEQVDNIPLSFLCIKSTLYTNKIVVVCIMLAYDDGSRHDIFSVSFSIMFCILR